MKATVPHKCYNERQEEAVRENNCRYRAWDKWGENISKWHLRHTNYNVEPSTRSMRESSRQTTNRNKGFWDEFECQKTSMARMKREQEQKCLKTVCERLSGSTVYKKFLMENLV